MIIVGGKTKNPRLQTNQNHPHLGNEENDEKKKHTPSIKTNLIFSFVLL
jgi:hypothetical protein